MPFPDEAELTRARALRRQGALPNARRCLEALLEEEPRHATALRELGLVLHQSGETQTAVARLKESLQIDPDSPETLLALALVQTETGNFAEAGESIGRAAEGAARQSSQRVLPAPAPGKPERVAAGKLNDHANELYRMSRLTEAAAAYEAALATTPEDPTIITNLANVRLAENRLAESIAGYEHALRLQPHDPWIRYCLGIATLTAGDFDRGWQHFESRLDREPLWREVNLRRWQGQPSVPAGKSLLLLSEQGLGDVLHFLRYVPAVTAMGYRVSIVVDKELKPLLVAQAWLEAVYAKQEPRPDFDEYCPLLSLPWILRDTRSTPPTAVPYLRAPSEPLALARGRLAGFAGVRIGFVWAGNPLHERDRLRSLTLPQLATILPQGEASLFSLQKRCPETDREALAGLPVLHDLSGELSDFAATAAFISQLDLVVSVDTSVAHLAGALAVPVWIMLPFAPDWRWRLGCTDSPLYPTARLYRQPALLAWAPVLDQIGQDLTDFVRNKRDRRARSPF